jgi:ABC-type lipoprotein export system ATPase subunit
MLLESKNVVYTHSGMKPIIFPDISLERGEAILILGQSGSGKTTFLNLLGGLLTPDKGSIALNGIVLSKLKGQKLDLFRGKEIGIVFQKPHLIAALTVRENLELTHYFGQKKGQDLDQLLDELDLSSRSHAPVLTLSEGEAQRVSIARALANEPQLILADEPTSSLDDENAAKVIELLQSQTRKIGAALIIVTHDQRVKSHIPNFIQVQSP